MNNMKNLKNKIQLVSAISGGSGPTSINNQSAPRESV